jgi:hypothetical protein
MGLSTASKDGDRYHAVVEKVKRSWVTDERQGDYGRRFGTGAKDRI